MLFFETNITVSNCNILSEHLFLLDQRRKGFNIQNILNI